MARRPAVPMVWVRVSVIVGSPLRALAATVHHLRHEDTRIGDAWRGAPAPSERVAGPHRSLLVSRRARHVCRLGGGGYDASWTAMPDEGKALAARPRPTGRPRPRPRRRPAAAAGCAGCGDILLIAGGLVLAYPFWSAGYAQVQQTRLDATYREQSAAFSAVRRQRRHAPARRPRRRRSCAAWPCSSAAA